jgi:DNA-binding response OmpR family regulator
VLSREAIRDKVGEDNNYKDIRAVDTHIKNLRIKLKENGESIKTIRGYGYKIE